MKATLGRRQYWVCADRQLADGRVVQGVALCERPMTRYQAKKSLRRLVAKTEIFSVAIEARRHRLVRPRVSWGQSIL
jgi:hypothetical protein